MCPLCWINSLLLIVFGSSAIAFVQNPWTIAFAIITTILAIYFAYKGVKKNGGKGGLQRNLTTTFLVIASFMFGYLFAAYQTHDYFESRTHHTEEECETCDVEESKEQVLLMDDNIDPIMLNPLNDYVQTIEKTKEALTKEQMRAEMMKHATVTEEVMCECPYHEQLEKDSNINVK